MIVAMGQVSSTGTLYNGYNVVSVTWNAGLSRWEIQLTGINYFYLDYVTVITPFDGFATQGSVGGKLLVYIYDAAGNGIKTGFSFVVLRLS
jgi:hypothetical protein